MLETTVIIITVLLVILCFSKYYGNNLKESFLTWDYEYPLSIHKYKDSCQLQGLIDQMNNSSYDSCYNGYYIPSIYNYGTYVSEVNPDA